jgi:hypothetical protein
MAAHAAGMRIIKHTIVSLTACSGAATPTVVPASSSAAPATLPTGDIRDFDFIAGAWSVSNRRLKARGVGSTEWEEFPGTVCGRLYLDGVANVDELAFPTKGWAGITLRTFDREARRWSIYWVNSRQGKLFPPVVGGFTGDDGEFYGTDTDDGRAVTARFRWTKQGPDRALWEQAFSYDGKTWEVNWTNELVRADPASCR